MNCQNEEEGILRLIYLKYLSILDLKILSKQLIIVLVINEKFSNIDIIFRKQYKRLLTH
jgi:hypothetical protein